jgi:lysophospholipase L1-like esterase
MFGDSFFRGSAENVRTFLSEKCDVFSVVKPGADLSELTQSMKNEVLTLTYTDTLVLGGGSNDLDKYKSKTALKLTTEFVKSNNHTNIILLSIPHHCDLQNHSYLNNEIWKYNRKLFKIAQAFDHIKFIDLGTNRSRFTKHGLHFNKLGKAYLAKQIASTVQLLLDKKNRSSSCI